ncbi:6-pyruvoyl tetrahydropterin synthase protein [Rhizobium phage RHph_I1_18]|nr:6-pyruvoyl tetrahydropterin synthase protein [Rhizobium phage RHph_I1_18]
MIEIRSTKSFYNLPTAHSQYFDKEPDGSPGECGAFHGYDRSVHFEFAGQVDENGWIFPFGELKEVKSFLEYYFDHTSVLPADDPRIKDIPREMTEPGGLLQTLRILPYGVSMEMSSLFVWEQVNPYIYQLTGGRVYVPRVEIKEHEKNSGFIIVDRESASKQAQLRIPGKCYLQKQRFWDYMSPAEALEDNG